MFCSPYKISSKWDKKHRSRKFLPFYQSWLDTTLHSGLAFIGGYYYDLERYHDFVVEIIYFLNCKIMIMLEIMVIISSFYVIFSDPLFSNFRKDFKNQKKEKLERFAPYPEKGRIINSIF